MARVLDRARAVVGDQVLARLPNRLAGPIRSAARRRRRSLAVDRLRHEGLDVLDRIDPADEMFDPRDPGHYFWVGRSALDAVERGLAEVGVAEPARILDMPCGHGRVLRLLRARWPQAAFTACDLNRPAVDFCVDAFGATGIYSADPVSGVAAPADFDLVWVGSLFTHLDADRWPDLLRWLRDRVRAGGAVIFTTHGAEAARRIEAGDEYGLGTQGAGRALDGYRAGGFGYAPYPWDPDYGVSLSGTDWVRSCIAGAPGLELVSLRERAWADHQDVVTLRRVVVEP